jgi:hypothetical protein
VECGPQLQLCLEFLAKGNTLPPVGGTNSIIGENTTKHFLLGRSGLRVSELALGAMSFGTEWGWGTDINEARKMLDLYIDNGGNFVDTANQYTNGSSERMLGELLGEKRQHPGGRPTSSTRGRGQTPPP